MNKDRPRKSRLARILEKYPYCIYCGGDTPASTCDHMPPRQLFDFKQRPAGLEFPSCLACNSKSGHAEQVVSLISRIYPDGGSEAHRKELEKLLNAVSNNNPNLLPSLLPKEFVIHQRLLKMGLALPKPKKHLSLESPVVQKAFDVFSTKLFLALHFEHTKEIIGHSGGVQYFLFTNLDAVNGNIPKVLSDLLQSPSFLKQGRRHTASQFFYGHQIDEEAGLGLYFVAFRWSFALCGIVARDTAQYDFWGNQRILRPFKAAASLPTQ